jgi:large subunit ribosomal protein L15
MKFAEKQGSSMKIDLTKAGYDKVLGNGSISGPLEIHAKMFSKQAEAKIQEAGGKAVKV